MQRFPCTRFVPDCKQITNLLEKFIESPCVRGMLSKMVVIIYLTEQSVYLKGTSKNW